MASMSQNLATGSIERDPDYPGTALERMRNAVQRASSLSNLNSDWSDVRASILFAGGLKNLPDAVPGRGYTGHAFNDYNHCDLTCMLGDVADNENKGQVRGIAVGNQLGPGITVASLPELGPGGSWSTCTNGCSSEPPSDVAHIQFRSRIAFKLVWCPPEFDTFVLVDDSGEELNRGTPTGQALPALRERSRNFAVVRGSKYARAAESVTLE
eukprot:CAMPEP_0185743806 /NCGR_PEP_ID=MMETSP1174-20130828/1723_1 /TAXON_ID=35687 /ORGANISM="Dictyocha speculum, Strain CCMP1381" /LENGTH=211 /DNA_ID=CAMNT_0028416791 /DNA_START=78 /DNA_END=713 /DNA_ORIENTATION=+